MADETSSQWTKAKVLEHLREVAQSGQPVAAQIFLNDDVASNDVTAAVERIVSKVEKIAEATGVPVKVGKIHQLAKSFSVRADPEAVAAIADQPMVKSILPSEINDVYAKPVKVKPV